MSEPEIINLAESHTVEGLWMQTWMDEEYVNFNFGFVTLAITKREWSDFVKHVNDANLKKRAFEVTEDVQKPDE